ncbi:MAG TPA: hypothetical protein VIS48_00260 [Candidatus Kryptonia bacterium]
MKSCSRTGVLAVDCAKLCAGQTKLSSLLPRFWVDMAPGRKDSLLPSGTQSLWEKGKVAVIKA